MISRKAALKAGKALNALAHTSPDAEEAVAVANAVMFQYYLIPRSVREEYFRGELVADGIRLQNLPEERV